MAVLVPEWSNGVDCKSIVREFESHPALEKHGDVKVAGAPHGLQNRCVVIDTTGGFDSYPSPLWGCSSVGRTLPLHGRGRWFESSQLHFLKRSN